MQFVTNSGVKEERGITKNEEEMRTKRVAPRKRERKGKRKKKAEIIYSDNEEQQRWKKGQKKEEEEQTNPDGMGHSLTTQEQRTLKHKQLFLSLTRIALTVNNLE